MRGDAQRETPGRGDARVRSEPREDGSGDPGSAAPRAERRGPSGSSTASRLVRFCAVGTTGMVVDLVAVRALLSFHWPFEVARALAIWVAMTWNFGLNRRWTFGGARADPMLAQYVRFAAACGLGAAINWFVAVGLVRTTHLFSTYPLGAAFVGVLAGTGSNFAISSRWVFRSRRAVATTVESRPSGDAG
jgi:putative flippase GtrA